MIRLAVRVARADAEAVLAELLELAPGGLEEREAGEDAVEYVLYGAPGEVPDLGAVRAAAGDALVEVRRRRSPTTGPSAGRPSTGRSTCRWRFRRLRVRPPWEPPLDGDGIDLVIDPGQAFGTGAHHTTRLCLELLLELEPAGALADWGCGTGVLAIAAARLGWDPVLACDWEAASVAATAGERGASTARRASRSRAPTCGARKARGRRRSSPTSCGRCCSRSPAGMTRPPERMILSGLLREEAAEVAAAFARHGLRERDRRHGRRVGRAAARRVASSAWPGTW